MKVLNRTAATTATLILVQLTLENLHGFLSGYVVQYSEAQTHGCISDDEGSMISSIFPDNGTILLTGLNPMKEYCVRVAARTSEGVGPFSSGTDVIQCESSFYS